MGNNSKDRPKPGKPSDKNVTAFPETSTKPIKGTPVPAIHDMLGAKLKAYYSAIASEPIPDRLQNLMAELEALSAEKPEPAKEDGTDT